MTTDEKDRLEIVKEVCSLQDCTLQEIYNFVKTGKAVTGPLPRTANNPEPATLADGVYIVTKDGRADKFTGTNLILDCDNPVIGIGVKQGDRAVLVALTDAADGDDVTLTAHEDNTDYDGYIDTSIDAVADWSGKANTDHLREIGLNPAINLKDGEYIPSVGEMYLIYTHRKEINAALRHVGGQEIFGKWYWTSTEYSAKYAWGLTLSNGHLTPWPTKASSKGRVRPVSAFNFNR